MALVWNNRIIFVLGPDPDSGDISLGRGVDDFVAVKDVAVVVVFFSGSAEVLDHGLSCGGCVKFRVAVNFRCTMTSWAPSLGDFGFWSSTLGLFVTTTDWRTPYATRGSQRSLYGLTLRPY